MQILIPHLWYDTEAREAVERYTSLFPDSGLDWSYTITDTPSGDAEMIHFHLGDTTMAAISAGPYFQLNESISLMIDLSSKEELNRIYKGLMDGGRELMPLDEYDFSPYYAWVEDKYGLSWQLSYNPEITESFRVSFCLLFSEDQVGLAENALKTYQECFVGSYVERISYYQSGEALLEEAKINYSQLRIGNQDLILMDHGYGGENSFNEAFSFMLLVDTQEEADAYYEHLSAVPEAEICGWTKDTYSVSWQIVPRMMMASQLTSSQEKMQTLNQAILKMKRLDIAEIEKLLNS
ncbi:VOC family protein [Streptococcus hyovaginalis]|uniref:VOC family protein n=1 Tax=Streptococcus hyovaginalis TaxID=149015 RepID=UPI003ADFAFCC